jgi:hypothetical protein
MTGRLDLTPWARQVIPAADRDAIRCRVPAGYVLRVSATYRTLHVRLVDLRVGFVSEVDGPYPWAIERALEALDVA